MELDGGTEAARRTNQSGPGGQRCRAGHGSRRLAVEPGDWPQFRGPGGDDRVAGVRIETDWTKHPPQLEWKHPVGPGWSSFSVVGDVCFTQEQRGEEESTVCYRLADGAEVWAHGDAARFWDPATGAGPRGVPAFHEGKLFTVGATGLVDCLDAATGQLVWQRNLLADVDASLQQWGVATSPLVVGQLVVAFAGGGEGKGTIAYARATGEPVWTGGRGTHSFSSPQLARLAGVEQILMAHDLGLDALDPASGKLLWHYDWSLEGNGRMLQPCLLGDDRVVLASGYNQGTQSLKVALADGGLDGQGRVAFEKVRPLLQQLRRLPGARLRLRRQYLRLRRFGDRRAEMEKGAYTATGRFCCWPTRECCW